MGHLEPRHHARGAVADRRGPALRRQRDRLASAGAARRRRPMGRLDARVGHHLSAPALQLRDGPGDDEPPAALGPQAPRRPRRSPRMSAGSMSQAVGGPGGGAALAPPRIQWRGRIGILGLIVAEISLFAVFVVAYLFYIGKSVNGP